MIEKRTFLFFLSWMMFPTVIVCAARTPDEPMQEEESRAPLLTPHSRKQTNSKLSIMPSAQSKVFTPAKRSATADAPEARTNESLFEPPALGKKVQATVPTSLKQTDEKPAVIEKKIPSKSAPLKQTNQRPSAGEANMKSTPGRLASPAATDAQKPMQPIVQEAAKNNIGADSQLAVTAVDNTQVQNENILTTNTQEQPPINIQETTIPIIPVPQSTKKNDERKAPPISKGAQEPKKPRRRLPKKEVQASLEATTTIPAPELLTPKMDEPIASIPSMADAPTTDEKKEFLKEGIDTTLSQKEGKKEEHTSFEKLVKKGSIYLGDYLEPWKGTDPHETVEMNFDNKELTELLKFLSNNLDVTFILDDDIEPSRIEGMQPLAGTRISFKSNVPLTLKQAWEMGLTFLEMAGFSVIPATQPRTYRVTTSASRDRASANREPLPTFIGTDPELLPDNDSKIRYVYFADNAEIQTIIQIIDAMKSPSAGPLIEVPQLKAVIMTDKAANIKSLINILQEIDRVTLPETLAIIRLRHADARQVRELYQRLIGKDPSSPIFNPFARQRKSNTTQYFSEATRVFEEPRTNSLIVLGTRENIKRFEDFIVKYVDKSIDLPFSPLHIVQLKYIDATSVAKILNDTIQKFNSDPTNTAAALVGGVRDSNKFFRPSVRVTDEPAGNRLIINADYEEYLQLREIIEKLDVEQPQVAIKVLILNVDLSNTETLGTQLRNKVDCCDRTGGLDSLLGTNVNFQTNFIGPIVTNEPAPGSTTQVNGAYRLLGNLINLANRVDGISPFGIGTTLVTLGQDMFGFWGLLRALETYTRVSIVANPFLVTTHKYKAEIRVGETRRTTTATVQGQSQAQAQGDISAELRVVITPQISYDDMVTLNVYVELTQFTTTDPNNANRLIRKVSTEALLANKEVLALGGLIQDTKNEQTYKVPFFGDIPFLGWLFKNKTYYIERTSLLILIAPEIIKPFEPEVAEAFTFSKLGEAKDTLFKMRNPAELRDPIHRWMFNDHKNKEVSSIDKFVSMQQRYIDESQKKSEVLALAPLKTGAPKNDKRKYGSKGAAA